MSNFQVKSVRALTALVVGYVASYLMSLGVNVSPATLTLVVAPLLTAGYYAVARFLEYYFPALTRMLGVPQSAKAEVAKAEKIAVAEATATLETTATAAVEQVTKAAASTKKAAPTAEKKNTPQKSAAKKTTATKSTAKKAPATKKAPPKK